MRLRPWLIPAVAAVVALGLFVAGMVTWRMTPGVRPCPPNSLCLTLLPPHRLHPLRAELLWAASAVFGLIAVGVSLRPWLAGAGQPAGNASA